MHGCFGSIIIVIIVVIIIVIIIIIFIIIIPVFSFLLLRTRKRPYKNRKSKKTASKQLATAVQHGDQLEDNEDDQPVINTSITISTTINI